MVAFVMTVAAEPSYVVTEIGTLPGFEMGIATSINNRGEVAGFARSGFTNHAFLFSTNGTLVDLGTGGADGSYAFGVNDFGQVAGARFFNKVVLDRVIGSPSYAYIYTGGVMITIGPTQDGYESDGRGLNNSGQVVGHVDDGTNNIPFVYTGGTLNYLTLNGEVITNAFAYAINDRGEIALELDGEPAIYFDGSVRYFNDFRGFLRAIWAINNSGDVVGSTDLGDDRSHAFVVSGGQMRLIEAPGEIASEALGINDLGHVVGSLELTPLTPDGPRHGYAFLYKNGVLTNLNLMIPPEPPYFVGNAFDINNTGQIAANATNSSGNTFAVRLDPITSIACSMQPPAATNRTARNGGGASQEIIIRLLANTNKPVSGVTVDFRIISGPNKDKTATQITDRNGEARFTYAGSEDPGTDMIEAKGTVAGLPFSCQSTVRWIAPGIQLRPILALGCKESPAQLELTDLATGADITLDPNVTWHWIKDGDLSALLLEEVFKRITNITAKLAKINVDKGKVTFEEDGINLVYAEWKTPEGQKLESGYSVVIGGLKLSAINSLRMAPISAASVPLNLAAQLTEAVAPDFEVNPPMILFPPPGTLIGTNGIVKVTSIKFEFLGGLIEDVELMSALEPITKLIFAVSGGWIPPFLSRNAAQVGLAQFLDFEIVTEADDEEEEDAGDEDGGFEDPVIGLAEDGLLNGHVFAKQSGISAIQATLDMEKYIACAGKATALMWVWVLPDLEKVEVRNEAGLYESPVKLRVGQERDLNAVGIFNFLPEYPIPFDASGLKETDVTQLLNWLMPGWGSTWTLPPGAALADDFYRQGRFYVGASVRLTPFGSDPGITISNVRLQVPMPELVNTWSINPGAASVASVTSSGGVVKGLSTGTAFGNVDVRIPTLTPRSAERAISVSDEALSCALLLGEETNSVGRSTVLLATVLTNNFPVANVPVSFRIESGPHAGGTGSDTTKLEGGAAFSYTGTSAGTDVIIAQGTYNGKSFSCAATRIWTSVPPSCVLSPLSSTGLVGSQHSVVVTVRSAIGDLLPGAAVNFLITSGPNQGRTFASSTDFSGSAVFNYTGGGVPGTDVITVNGLLNGSAFSCSGSRTWTSAVARADLVLTKAAPTSSPVGEDLVYNITLRNNGPDVARGVVVSDNLPGGVQFVSAASSRGGCSGTSAVDCFVGDLPSGADAAITIIVRPSGAGTLVNTAAAAGTTDDPQPGNNSASTTTAVTTRDLAINKIHSPASIAIGQIVTYTITSRNLGPSAALDVRVSDPLPAGLTLISATSSHGTVSTGSEIVANIGSLDGGASATLTIQARATTAGKIVNTASLSGRYFRGSLLQRSASDTLDVRGGPGITSITPSSGTAGSSELELTVNGFGFVPGTTIVFEPAAGITLLPAQPPNFGFVSPAELRPRIAISPTASPGDREVFVINPDFTAGGEPPFNRFTINPETTPVRANLGVLPPLDPNEEVLVLNTDSGEIATGTGRVLIPGQVSASPGAAMTVLPQTTIINGVKAPDIVNLHFQRFTLPSDAYLQIEGTRAVLISAEDDIVVHGEIDARGQDAFGDFSGDFGVATPGAPGGPGGFAGGDGQGPESTGSSLHGQGPGGGRGVTTGAGSVGGGGAGYGGKGGVGGTGCCNTPGTGGNPYGNAAIIPLIGGSGGGSSSWGISGGAGGGGGGGVIQLKSPSRIVISGSIDVSGGYGAGVYDGGSGGGSGGSIVIEAPEVTVSGDLFAEGGGGGDGTGFTGAGGVGGWDERIDGEDGFQPGGGGGGGAGRIRVNATRFENNGVISPGPGTSLFVHAPFVLNAPSLAFSRSGNRMTFSWDAAGYQLESTQRIGANAAWSPVTEILTTSNGRTFVDIEITSDKRFFRLKKAP